MQEGPDLSRRDFLLSAANIAILSAIGIFVGFPIIEIFKGRAREKSETQDFLAIAKVSELLPGKPLQKTVTGTQYDAWNKRENVNMGSVWLVKEEEGQIRAFSSICPHLGCIYAWNSKENHFVCPCHVSSFSLEGQMLKGPSPRNLDSLEVKTEGNEVLVRFQKFIPGIPQKKVI